MNMNNPSNNKSFTLLELLIVIAILAILTATVLIVISPAEYFRKTRDTKRITDLRSLNESLGLYLAEYGDTNMGSPKTVYISLPSNDPTCAADYPNLPSLPTGWQYHCAPETSYQKTDGTGWIPVNFQSISFGSPLSHLPIDPVNSADQGLYYAYVTGGSWELTAIFESKKYLKEAVKDGGSDPTMYEIGSDTSLSPFLHGLVGAWKFNEGGGTTAYDSSGNDNDGTIYGASWVDGKVGKALSFDGDNDYVEIPSVNPQKAITVCAWIKSYDSYYKALWQLISKYSAYILGTSGVDSKNVCFIINSGGWQYGSCYNVSNPEEWHFFCGTYDSTIIAQRKKLYVDGILRDSTNPSGLIAADTGPINIGQRECCPGQIFHGIIDEVRIYNRALSEREIKAIYEATK